MFVDIEPDITMEEFVRFVEIPAPHNVIHGFIKKVDIVLGILTVRDGFVILAEIELGNTRL